jgi:hypothetical protein
MLTDLPNYTATIVTPRADAIPPVPETATELRLEYEWCGDDYCNCYHFELRAITPGPWLFSLRQSVQLWESNWMSEPDARCFRESVERTCQIYGVPVDTSSDFMYDWEFKIPITGPTPCG